MDRRNRWPAGLALLVTLALAAVSASAAQAAVWSIEEKSLTAKGVSKETTAFPEKTMSVTSVGLGLEMSCTLNGLGAITAGSKGEATLKMSGCTVGGGKCTVSEIFTILNGIVELTENKATGAIYEVITPASGKGGVLTTIKFAGKECVLPTEAKLTGALAGQLETKQAVEQPVKFSQAINEAAGVSLLIAGKVGAYSGTTVEKLSGSNLGKKWGACAACDYSAKEGYGGGNPASPGVCKKCAGDPVDIATGNFTETQTDLKVEGRGPMLGLIRSYNAQLAAAQKEAEVGPFGYGWTGSYSASLAIDEKAATATVTQDNGSSVVFYLNAGTYAPAAWVQARLVKEGESYVYTLPGQEKLEFSKAGQLTKVTDRHKNSLTLTYKEGKLETVKDAAGRTLTFTYKEGKVESVKDPLGNIVKYTYESGNLATVTLPGEISANWKFKYDASHRLTEITDGRANTTKNEYDASNRVTLQTEPLERKRKFEYATAGTIKETTITEPNGSKTVQKSNEAGEPLSITSAAGTAIATTSTYSYDNALHMVSLTDGASHTTTFEYDAEGNRTAEKDPNSNETTWVYNSTHDVTKETTPGGEITTITRNAAGDPESVKRPGPSATTQEIKFEWAENGDLKSETDPLGRKTTFEYNANGNRKAEIDPEGDKTTWGYDEDGRVTSQVSPRGNEEGAKASEFETKTERDGQGRATKITDPLGHETKFKYDAAGNLEVQTNANGHATTYVYNAANERSEVKAANGNVIKTAYDSEGNVKSRTDGSEHTTTYEHNLLEQISEVIDPLERKTVKTYDLAGNIKEVKDPEARTTTYTYDPGNRLKEINYSDAGTADVSYEYSKDDLITVMKDGTGTSKYTYDVLSRPTETENGNKEIVKYEYDLANQAIKITYPNGKSISRGFDKAGRLEKVTDWLGKETKFSYSRDSFPKATTFPATSENKDEYEYNQANQLTKTTMKKGATTLASIAYARDNLGQLKSATQTGLPGAAKPEYEYDEKERLKKGAGTAFEYNAADSPIKLGTATLKYDKASQLEEGGGIKYAFDKLGERTKATPEKGPATTYGYDQAGNLISITRKAEGEVKEVKDTYAYDGRGLRATETIGATTTHMAWDAVEGLPLLLADGTNSYLYGPEGLPFEQINSKEEASYLHHDQQGSTRAITNAAGEVKGTFTYSPYGAIEGQTGTATTPLGYSAQYTSADTGLIYLRARVYDPATAQFMSVDPLQSTTGETYGYALDNPLNSGDPSGKAVPAVLSIPVITGWLTAPVLIGWTTMPVITGMTTVMTPFGPMYTPLFTWMTTPLFSWVTMPIFNWYSMPVVLVPLAPLPPMPPPQGPAVIVLDENGNVMPQGGAMGEECE
jgi:RHS repeat-associated protein